MSQTCPPTQNNHIFLVSVTVTGDASNPQISYSPETLTVDKSTSLIVFQLLTPGWAFPDDGSAIQVLGTDPVSKGNAAKQFPTAWVSPTVLALQDHNNCSSQKPSTYNYSLSVIHSSTALRLCTAPQASIVPEIQNDPERPGV